MKNKDQEQNVEPGGTALQAGGNIILSTGLSYSEVRDLALDVFKANFYELAEVARQTAVNRAEEITESFLTKLQNEYPAGLERSHEPDFQVALFTVQKEYARNGDKDLGDLLVDLLVDRSKQEHRDILQIVLNESLSTAPKLTDNQLAALALIFLFKYTQNFDVGNHVKLGQYLDKYAAPFIPKVVTNLACYQHLEFTGCGAIGLGESRLESILGTTYQGLFLKGFDKAEVDQKEISLPLDETFIVPCLNDTSKFQIKALTKVQLDKVLDQHSIMNEDRDKINGLFNNSKMSNDEIKQKCIEIRPYMSDLFNIWSESAMKHFTLTSVGIAIGHANIKRLVGEFANLAIWIN